MILFLLFTNNVISHIVMRNPARKDKAVWFFIVFINDTVEKQVEMPPQKEVGRKIKHMVLQNGSLRWRAG